MFSGVEASCWRMGLRLKFKVTHIALGLTQIADSVQFSYMYPTFNNT